MLEHWWIKLAGTSLAGMRALCVVFSLGAVLAMLRSWHTRYFLPLFLASDALLAWFLSGNLGERFPTQLGSVLFGVILSLRLASCLAAARAETWWNKLQQQSIAVAATINARPHPLLVSDGYSVWALSIAEYLRPDVRVLVRPECYLCDGKRGEPLRVPPTEAGDLFLLGPSPALKSELQSRPDRCIDTRSNCVGDLSLWEANEASAP